MPELERRGLLIILSSPSGVGKSTIARRLCDYDQNIIFSVSATTRKARKGEKNGREYFFLDHSEFDKKVQDYKMLEYAKVFGNWYGTPIDPVLTSIDKGKDVIFDVDWQGGNQIKNSRLGKYVLSFFLLPPSIKELERRLVSRNQDDTQVIRERMSKAEDEISHWGEYDYVFINDELDKTEKKNSNNNIS